MDSQTPELTAPRTMRDFNGQSGTVVYGLDSGLHASFYIKPFHMEFLSEVHGSPIFQDRIYVRIVAPGNSKTVWDTFARGIAYDTAVDPESGEYFTEWTEMSQMPNGDMTDMQRYPNAWAAFKKKGEQPKMGYPIEEWGVITRSFAESLKLLNVHTVESLASLSDQAAQTIMGGMKYRELAKAHLDDKARNEIVARETNRADRYESQVTQLSHENDALKEQLDALQAQFAQLAGGLQNLQNPRASNSQLGGGQDTGANEVRKPAFKSSKKPQSARTRAMLNKGIVPDAA
jgi:hypothetical protein